MPDEEIDSDIPEISAEPLTKRSIFKCRRWIWVLTILLVICFLINGPFVRWLALYGLNKGLEAQGMTGRAEISGSLSDGFTIHDLSYSGNQGIQLLEIAESTTNYKFTELFSGRLRTLAFTDTKVVIDLDAFPPSKDKETSKSKLNESLAKLHGWISHPKISIDHLDITLLRSGGKQAHFQFTALDHAEMSNEFIISGFTASDRQERTTPAQNIRIVWEKESANIDRFEVLPDIAIQDVKIDWSKGFIGSGLLQFIESQLEVSAASDKITAKLSNGSIDYKQLTERFDLSLPAEFSLAELNIILKNWKQAPPKWDISADIKLSSVDYQDYKLGDTSIQLTQKEHSYELVTEGSLNGNPLTFQAKGQWLAPDSEEWWSSTSASYVMNVPRLGSLTDLLEGIPEKLKLTSTAIRAKGELTIAGSQLKAANVIGEIKGVIAGETQLLPLDIKGDYQHEGQTHAQITARRNGTPVLHLNADYHLNKKSYQASLKLNEPTPDWINALCSTFDTGITLDGSLDLTWSGHGNTQDFTDPKIHQKGQLSVTNLQLTLPDQPTLDIKTEIKYQWPESLDVSFLNVREGDWLAATKLAWNGQSIDVSSIEITEKGNQLATISGKLPFQRTIKSARQFLKQKEPWDIAIKTENTTLKKLGDWFNIEFIRKLTGTAQLDITLRGSPNTPEIRGSVIAKDVKGLDDSTLSPLHTEWDFYSEKEQLIIKGKLLEGSDQRFSFRGGMPFTVSTWLDDPDFLAQFISEAPISAKVDIDTLPLERLKPFVPQLEKIEGFINGKATLSGTLQKPSYLVDLDADIPLIRIAKSDIGDIRKIKLNTKFTENQKVDTKLTAQINGGEFVAGGSIDLKDINAPVFDLYLGTKYALVHRDDILSIRANSDLKLTGTMADATLSGSIGIAESLFYKDIELIPIGVPSSEVARVDLPALSKKKADDKLPIPEPFGAWKLDLTIRTDDPVLIRGNVASGNLTGSIKVGGTLDKPAPLGTVLVNKVKAKLPFSILEVTKGEIKFTPENGLDPTLNIRGKSTVGNHDVSVFVYGSASAPKTTFNSYPPLPETDVMTLVATGTTTAGLENRSVATFKAFQIFLKKLQQRNEKPDGNKLFKTLLSGIDDLNLNVGETDPFTGRKFTSATVDVHPHWNLTAQVDDTQQTRGLVVYVIRFR